MRNSTRSDSKAGYIDTLPPRSNLVILTGQQVTKVNFNGSVDASGNIIASGVTLAASNTAQGYTVYASKEVAHA
jgi:choline dehydrogenase